MADYLLLFSITRTLKDGTKQYKNGWEWFQTKEELADTLLMNCTDSKDYIFNVEEILEINSYDNLEAEDIIEECASYFEEDGEDES